MGSTAQWQDDGNFVVYRGRWPDRVLGAMWATGTVTDATGLSGMQCIMQPDGNLVLSVGGTSHWSTGLTPQQGPTFAVMQDNGDFVLYRGTPTAQGAEYYATGTAPSDRSAGPCRRATTEDHYEVEETPMSTTTPDSSAPAPPTRRRRAAASTGRLVRRSSILTTALLVTAATLLAPPASAQPELSPGCSGINELGPSQFIAVSGGTFFAGEHVFAFATTNEGPLIDIRVDGVIVAGPGPDEIGYTIPATGVIDTLSVNSDGPPIRAVCFPPRPPRNDEPTSTADSYSTVQNTPLTVAAPGVLGNDTDPDDDPLTATVGTDPTNGTLTLNSDGSLTYTPDSGFVGTDTFTYTATDGTDTSAPATVTITVTAATCDNAPPGSIVGTAGNNVLTGTAGDDLIYGLGGNDAVNGRGGNDLICGGPGNDALTGGDGNDRMFGQAGNDALNGGGDDDALSGGDGNDAVNGGAGTNNVDGGLGTDACINPTTGPGCP